MDIGSCSLFKLIYVLLVESVLIKETVMFELSCTN